MKKEITYNKFKEALKIVNQYQEQMLNHVNNINKDVDSISKFKDVTKDMIISNTNISMRLGYSLKSKTSSFFNFNVYTTKIEDLTTFSISKFAACRNVGKETINELKELCAFANVKLLK